MKYLCQFALALAALHQVKGLGDIEGNLTILETITCGSSVDGGMTGIGVQYYLFDFNGSEYDPQYSSVVFDACNATYNTYIWFYDNNGTLIDEDDDYSDDTCGDRGQLLITDFDQGNYIVGVGSCCAPTQWDWGNFTLDVTCSNTTAEPSTTAYHTTTNNDSTTTEPPNTSETSTTDKGYSTTSVNIMNVSALNFLSILECGMAVNGSMNGTDIQYYEFHFSGSYFSPDTTNVLFDVCNSSTTYDTYLWVYHSNGTFIDDNDDADGCGRGSQLWIVDLSQGNYIIGVGAYDGEGYGDFTLEVTCESNMNGSSTTETPNTTGSSTTGLTEPSSTLSSLSFTSLSSTTGLNETSSSLGSTSNGTGSTDPSDPGGAEQYAYFVGTVLAFLVTIFV